MSDLLREYEKPWSFESGGIAKKVYSRGRGPDVVIMHEVFGLDEHALQLGIDLSDQFRVHLPLLFGDPGASSKIAWVGAASGARSLFSQHDGRARLSIGCARYAAKCEMIQGIRVSASLECV